MNCLSSTKNMIQLLDLPDEMILAIMNKVKPEVLLFCSISGIGNNRLEKLALDKCHSIDLTFDYYYSPYDLLVERLYSYVMPHISNSVQSLAINFKHLIRISTVAKMYDYRILPNLKHLKITIGYNHLKTGAPVTLSSYDESSINYLPLFSTVPELFGLRNEYYNRLLLFFRCSPLMRSIVSLELEPHGVFKVPLSDEGLLFPQSLHLTHLHITLSDFNDCVRLFHQVGPQLHSLSVTILFITVQDSSTTFQLASISCPNLKQLTMTFYRNIFSYEQLLPLFQRLSTVEHLSLLLAICVDIPGRYRFIDGFDLQRDIISHMPNLRQFNFHIRSTLFNAPYIEADAIRQSFIKKQQPVDCALDYFDNQYGQCHIYSLPFIGNRLDFISNRFPLFDVKNTFSNVTTLLIFDDINPFESTFFERLARALPRLKTLDICNQLEQQEKTKTTANVIEFPHLVALILHNIHVSYAKQLLCRSCLPHLVELVIRYASLLTIIAENNQQARNNCSTVERLRVVEPWIEPTYVQLKFFPSIPNLQHS